MNDSEKIIKKFFGNEVLARDRAIFEAGISLGALFHQFIGMPLKKDKIFISNVEKMIEESISTQPYIKSVDVKINFDKLKNHENPYDYSVLNSEIIDVKLISEYENIIVYSRIKFIEELNFPLMFIEKIEG
ncbi:MAG: dihydroneopterin aldolase family protein [Candidatus Helarchaeota archaeon]